jgi:hypothetical protein
MTAGRIVKSGCAIAILALMGSAAAAGENNRLYVIQQNTGGSPLTGNSLTADQTDASNSLIAGPSQDLLDREANQTLSVGDLEPIVGEPAAAAQQLGQNNKAGIVLSGNGGQLQILQDNTNTPGVGNTAAVTGGTDALGAVLQIGDDNFARLDLDTGATGLIAQRGFDNSGTLSVAPGATGELIQNGNGNTQGLEVFSRNQVTATQNGNNLQPVNAQAIQVFSTNPGVISITQTGF